MEKYLLELLKLADYLNKNQEKVCSQITYYADENKTLEICIRSKKDFSHIEECQIQLKHNPQKKLKMITELFSSYVGGVFNE